MQVRYCSWMAQPPSSLDVQSLLYTLPRVTFKCPSYPLFRAASLANRFSFFCMSAFTCAARCNSLDATCIFKAKQNFCYAYMLFFRKRNKCHFSLEHFKKSTIPSTFPVTAGKTKTWGIFLLICLLLMFDAMANYLHWFIQPIAVGWLWSTLGHVLQVWSLLGLTTEHTLSCRSPPDRPLRSLQWRAVTTPS